MPPWPDGISIHEAIQVSRVNRTRHLNRYRVLYWVQYPTRYLTHYFGQQGLMPALDSDLAEVITGSEFIVKAYAYRHSLSATAINDLIKNVL